MNLRIVTGVQQPLAEGIGLFVVQAERLALGEDSNGKVHENGLVEHAGLTHLGVFVPAAEWNLVLLLDNVDKARFVEEVGQVGDDVQTPAVEGCKGPGDKGVELVDWVLGVGGAVVGVGGGEDVVALYPAAWF